MAYACSSQFGTPSPPVAKGQRSTIRAVTNVLLGVLVLLIHWLFISFYCDVVNQEKRRLALKNEQLEQEVARLQEALQALSTPSSN